MAKVLVAEDDSMLRYLVCDAIERAGHAVCAATDGRHALEMLPQVRPDLVVTDIEMPFVNGIELVTEIRKAHPDLPVVVLSGAGSGLLRKAAQAGATMCLSKPIDDMDQFVARLQTLLGEAKAVA